MVVSDSSCRITSAVIDWKRGDQRQDGLALVIREGNRDSLCQGTPSARHLEALTRGMYLAGISVSDRASQLHLRELRRAGQLRLALHKSN